MDRWEYSPEQYPPEVRLDAWKTAIDRLHIPVPEPRHAADEAGFITCKTSPLGLTFARIDGPAMEFSGAYPNQAAAVWFAIIVSGTAEFIDDRHYSTLKPGDFVYGPTGVPATLRLKEDFQLLFINAPRLAMNARAFLPSSIKSGYIPARTGLQRVFSNMLLSLAENIKDIPAQQLRPVELAITEFLLEILWQEKSAFGLGGAAGARLAHLNRICQQIETQLGEPELSLRAIATMSGASPRYLQKLFHSEGKKFSSYLRTRRLERAKQDLANPLHADLSISDICFRWGFNGAAHFSRCFRSEYGQSPREFRKEKLSQQMVYFGAKHPKRNL